MARKKSYDVFISYRREGGLDFARSIAYCLRLEGYQCFFDQRELKSGQFNQQIFEAIENSRYFLIVLTQGSLDRCSNPGDWVRAEIEHAIEKGIPVVPVAVRGEKLAFPDSLPPGLAQLKSAQASFIDRETDFEDTIVKMLRNQLPDLADRTWVQHRRVRWLAEKTFFRKASRFKGNDGIINGEERAELERLASASGIGRIRLEELVEKVEAAAARRARIVAWMKSHVLVVSAIGLVGIALLAWLAVGTRAAMLPAEKHGGGETTARVDAPLPVKGKDTTRDIQTAAQEIAKLNPTMRWKAEMDFKHSLTHKKARSDAHEKVDSVAGQIIKEYETAAVEGRKLHELGMEAHELVEARPDLVMQFADIRIGAGKEMKRLIKANRHEEALNYYNSAKRAFEMLGMQSLDRPSFSK